MNKYIPKKENLKTKRAMLMPLYIFVSLLFVTACSGVDCPLDSLVYTQYQLLKSDGQADTLRDTLTITTTKVNGMDSVLLNRLTNTTEFSLPISYTSPQDIFYFYMTDTFGIVRSDIVTITKEDHPHFESVDCSPSYFHTITSVTCTNNNIDSIVIIHPEVNYDTSLKHFNIYFKHRN
ncbi:MAG: DUF6452 family protein [Prevotella sp.]|nr:DUF6452 family protein [Prevotella sp.]